MELFGQVGMLLSLMIALPMVRLIAGPTAPDRMVALDSVSTLVVGALLCFGLAYRSVIYIDVAIVYTILSYVTTLYIAKYVGGEL